MQVLRLCSAEAQEPPNLGQRIAVRALVNTFRYACQQVISEPRHLPSALIAQLAVDETPLLSGSHKPAVAQPAKMMKSVGLGADIIYERTRPPSRLWLVSWV